MCILDNKQMHKWMIVNPALTSNSSRAAGGAWDTTCLKPQVCFFILSLCYFQVTILTFHYIYVKQWQWMTVNMQQQRGLRCVVSRAPGMFLCFLSALSYSTNTYLDKWWQDDEWWDDTIAQTTCIIVLAIGKCFFPFSFVPIIPIYLVAWSF